MAVSIGPSLDINDVLCSRACSGTTIPAIYFPLMHDVRKIIKTSQDCIRRALYEARYLLAIISSSNGRVLSFGDNIVDRVFPCSNLIPPTEVSLTNLFDHL